MNPVYRRAPQNELPLEQLYHAGDRNARAKAAQARLTKGAQALMLAAGSFGQYWCDARRDRQASIFIPSAPHRAFKARLAMHSDKSPLVKCAP